MQQDRSGYFIDSDMMEEMHRLDIQGRLLTEATGGLLAERADFAGIRRVLDLACGSAEWPLAVAREHRAIEVVGVDKAPRMIQFAQARAKADHIENASFRVVDITGPLPFEDQSFDLVNARLLQSFMAAEDWPVLLRECRRVLRPTGMIRLTESERTLTNAPAQEQFTSLLTQALHGAGKGFSPNGQHHGVVFMLRRFLREAGFVSIQERAHAINFSYGMPGYESMRQDFVSGMPLLLPFMSRVLPSYTKDELEQLGQRALQEVREPWFCAIWFLLTASALNP